MKKKNWQGLTAASQHNVVSRIPKCRVKMF